MKYNNKLKWNEWVVLLHAESNQIGIAPKWGFQRFKYLWNKYGWHYIGEL